MPRVTTSNFIEKAKKIHGDKYDYSKTIYTKAHEKIIITCPDHGDFTMAKAFRHTNRKQGCRDCFLSDRIHDTASFVKKAKQIHKNEEGNPQYDYSKSVYTYADEIIITCHEHGDFEKSPAAHINQKQGCKYCSGIIYDMKSFIENAKKVHKNEDGTPKYIYDKSIYTKADEKIIITCHEHGDFDLIPAKHINDQQGCRECYLVSYDIDFDEYFKTDRSPKGFWKYKEKQKKYMTWLGKKLGYESMEDWYGLTIKLIADNHGYTFASEYGHSPYKILKNIFPEYKWLPWKLRAYKHFWEDKKNQEEYMSWLSKELGYETMEDWYQISVKTIMDYEGLYLTNIYHNNHYLMLKNIFPKYKWLPWKFNPVSEGFWKDKENQEEYMIWLGKEMKYETMEDWYQFEQKTIMENHGIGLSNQYNNSPFQVLKNMFPEYKWLPWKFGVSTNGFWKDKKNQEEYMFWLGKELGYETMEDWYKITARMINANYGCGILDQYNNSPYKILKNMFSKYEWLPWKFRAPRHFWEDKKNQEEYMFWLGKELGYETIEDWYKITARMINANYGCGILDQYNSSPYKILKNIFPEYEWKKSKFKKGYSVGQIEWLEYLTITIPDMRHILNNDDGEYKPIPSRRYKADGYSKLTNTIYEYNGDFVHGNPRYYNPTDISKKEGKKFGIIFIRTIVVKILTCIREGYNVKCIWESDWHRGIKAVKVIQRKFKSRRSS